MTHAYYIGIMSSDCPDKIRLLTAQY